MYEYQAKKEVLLSKKQNFFPIKRSEIGTIGVIYLTIKYISIYLDYFFINTPPRTTAKILLLKVCIKPTLFTEAIHNHFDKLICYFTTSNRHKSISFLKMIQYLYQQTISLHHDSG